MNLTGSWAAQKSEWLVKWAGWKEIHFEQSHTNLIPTITTWEQLKVGAAHLSGAKNWLNHWGEYHKKNQIFCSTVTKLLVGGSLVFLKYFGIRKTYTWGRGGVITNFWQKMSHSAKKNRKKHLLMFVNTGSYLL